MAGARRKLYAFTDESGLDTEGIFFVVGVVVVGTEVEELLNRLVEIERRSGKGNVKWHKARHQRRCAYLEQLSNVAGLQQNIYFQVFRGKNYTAFTAQATAKGVLSHVNDPYEVTVFLDGFREKEVAKVKRSLHHFSVKTRKVRGVRKEETNALIRLADAICGLIRDARDGWPWATETLKKLREQGMIRELE